MLNERFAKKRKQSAEQIQRLNDQIFLLQSRAENNDKQDTTHGRAGTPSQAVTLAHTYFAQSLCSSVTTSIPRSAGGGSGQKSGDTDRPARNTLKQDSSSALISATMDHDGHISPSVRSSSAMQEVFTPTHPITAAVHLAPGLSYDDATHSTTRGAIKSPGGAFNTKLTKCPESLNGGNPQIPNDGSNCAGREGESKIYGVSSSGVSAVGACTDKTSPKSPKSSNATSASSFLPGFLDTKSPKVTILPSPIMQSATPNLHTTKGCGAGDRDPRTFKGGGGAVRGEGGGGRSAARSGREVLEAGGGLTQGTMSALSAIPFPLTAAPAIVDAMTISSNQYPSPSNLRQPLSVEASQPSGVDEEIKRDAAGRGERATSPPLYHPPLPADSVLDESDLDAESDDSSPSLSVTLSHLGSSPFQTARSSIGWGAEAWEEAGGEREGGAGEYSRILKEDARGAVLMGEEGWEDGREEGCEADGGGGQTRRGTYGEAGIVLSAAYPFVIEDMQLDTFSPLPLQVCCSPFALTRAGLWAPSRASVQVDQMHVVLL